MHFPVGYDIVLMCEYSQEELFCRSPPFHGTVSYTHLNVERIPFDEMVHRCLDGEIEDAKTVTAVLKTKLLLNL